MTTILTIVVIVINITSYPFCATTVDAVEVAAW